MRLSKSRLFLVVSLALLFTTNCSGGGSGTTSSNTLESIKSSAAGPVAPVTAAPITAISSLPRPFDPSIDSAAKDSTPQENSEGSPFVYDRIAELKAAGLLPSGSGTSSRVRDNTYNGSGDGDGVVIGITNVGGVYAGQTVNTSFRPGGQNVVYAPTSRPGDPSCLEMSSVYDSANNNYFFGFYSFCGTAYPGNFYGRKYYTDAATSAYFATYDGQTIVTPEIREDASGVWHGYLYNYKTKVYEDLVDVGGSCGPSPNFTHSDAAGGCNLFNGTPNGGWDFYETHPNPVGETCFTSTRFSSYSLQTRVAQGSFSLLTTIPSQTIGNTYPSGQNGVYFNYGDCSNISGRTSPYIGLFTAANDGTHWLWDIEHY